MRAGLGRWWGGEGQLCVSSTACPSPPAVLGPQTAPLAASSPSCWTAAGYLGEPHKGVPGMDCQPFSQMKKLRLDKLPISPSQETGALSPVLPGSRAPFFTSINTNDKSNNSNNSKHSQHTSYGPGTINHSGACSKRWQARSH